MSAVQLFAGDALLPRFVVLGSALILVPWFVLCSVLEHDVDARAGERDRVLVVATGDEVASLEADLARSGERPALVVGWLSPFEAVSTGLGDDGLATRPLVELAEERRATVVVLSRVAQGDDDIVMQASQLHEAGLRIRTLSLFYEQWLGKLPIAELERFSLLFDIGELHAVGYARVKRLLDLALARVRLRGAGAGDPARGRRQPVRQSGSVVLPPAPRRSERRDVLDPQVPHDARGRARGHRAVDRGARHARHPVRWACCAVPTSTSSRRWSTSCAATCRWSGRGPSSRMWSTSSSGKIPFYRLRHLVRPGLTGWAQVKYQYAGTEAETLEKLQYEFFYLRRQSLGLDLRIVGRTARSVVGREGR